MSTVSWYETAEGKLAMCLALLLLILAVVMRNTDFRVQSDPRSGAQSAITGRGFEEKHVNNLAELPPLSPIDVPQPTVVPGETSLSPPQQEPPQPQPEAPNQTEPEPTKPKKRSSFFTFWLP